MELENTKLRRTILAEHDVLRKSLTEIEDLLGKVAAKNGDAQKLAHEKVQNLLQAFMRHLEHEERILQPVIQRIDAWGPARSASMSEEHATQRGEVTRLAGINPALNPIAWAGEVQAFIDTLLIDMAAEEKSILSPNVLRDDIIAVDGTSE